MPNGEYRTSLTTILQGPALITYAWASTMPVKGIYNPGSPATTAQIGAGFYIPPGASVTFERETLVSYVIPVNP